jgi:hypothetical protein
MKGLFIAYAISDAYLRYGGVIDVNGVEFKGAADRYSSPKVTIQEMPRLSTMLKDSGSMISADFSSVDDIKAIADRIIPCYSYVNSSNISLTGNELAKQAFGETNEYLARSNVKAMIRILEKH